MKKKGIVQYCIFAVIIALIVFFVQVWAINWRYLDSPVFLNSSISSKLVVLETTGDSFRQSFPLGSQVSIVILAVLAGIYASLLLSYVHRHYKMNKAAGLGILGSVFGSLGVGCGACGSVVLSSLLGASTTAAFLTLLPFKGLEFSGIGILILLAVIYLLFVQIRKQVICKR